MRSTRHVGSARYPRESMSLPRWLTRAFQGAYFIPTSIIGRLWLLAFGWKLEGALPVPESRFVLIAAPHTSNWDFPFMLATAWSLKIRVFWVGKHTLFRRPFGTVMRLLGGIPIDRRRAQNFVAQAVEAFRTREKLVLVLPPEGTRKRVELWKSGFYHIAMGAKVPIALGFLDYARKRCGLGSFFRPTGNIGFDMTAIREFYSSIRGKSPERESVPRLREESDGESTRIGVKDRAR